MSSRLPKRPKQPRTRAGSAEVRISYLPGHEPPAPSEPATPAFTGGTRHAETFAASEGTRLLWSILRRGDQVEVRTPPTLPGLIWTVSAVRLDVARADIEVLLFDTRRQRRTVSLEELDLEPTFPGGIYAAPERGRRPRRLAWDAPRTISPRIESVLRGTEAERKATWSLLARFTRHTVEPVCHGYANGCICAACSDRAEIIEFHRRAA